MGCQVTAWLLRAEIAHCEERTRTYIQRAVEAESIPGCRTLALECYALAEDWQSRADAAREALNDHHEGEEERTG